MPPSSKTVRLGALFAILVLAAFFRFAWITETPPGLYPDEATNGNNAVEALKTGHFKIFYPENNGREGLFINIQALSIKLFGPEPWALRIVSAIFGTLTVLGVYLLARELFPISFSGSAAAMVPLLSAFFLATSFWHIDFSRIGFRAITVPFFAVFAAYWLLKSFRTGKLSSALLAGVALGLGFHTYIAFRFLPFALLVPIAFALAAWRRREIKHCLPCLLAMTVLAAFAVALPLGFYFLNNPHDFFGRGGQVAIFSASSPLKEFAKSTALTLGMFNVMGDCNPRHNFACQPELFWPVGVLFLIGLAVTLRDIIRRPRTQAASAATLIGWFIIMMFPATLTREGLPHALRAIGMLPVVMILAAVGGARLWHAARAALARAAENPAYASRAHQIRRVGQELVIAAILFLIWIPVQTYRDYFVRFANAAATDDAFSSDLWTEGRDLAAFAGTVQTFVVVNLAGDDIRGAPAPAETIMFATDTFSETERLARHVSYVLRPEDIRIDAGAKVAIIPINPRDHALIKELRQRFPKLQPRIAGQTLILE